MAAANSFQDAECTNEKVETRLPDDSGSIMPSVEGPSQEEAIAYPNAITTAGVSLGVALGLFLNGLDMTIIATAIPRITEDFAGVNLIGWYSSAFFITVACFQPLWGKIYPLFSIKYTFLVAVFLFAVGSFIGGKCTEPMLRNNSVKLANHETLYAAGISPNSTVLILGRAIMGASAAGIGSGGYAILSVTVRPRLRPVFTGLITTIYSVANVLGPILGGIFSQQVTWRWCFYVNIPIAAVSALAIWLLFNPPPARVSAPKIQFGKKLSHMDPTGTILALAALICFTRAVEIAGNRKPWESPEVIGLLVGSALATVGFVISQYVQGDRALLMSRLMKQRVVYMSMLWGFFHEGAFYLLLYYVPIYFQVVAGVSPSEAGIRNLPLLISCGIGSGLAGFLVTKFGYYTPLMLWASAGGCVGAGLLCTLTESSGPAQWIGYQVLAGLALGTGMPMGIIAGQAKAKTEDLPPTTAMLLFTFCVGASTSLGVGQSVLSNLIWQRLPALAPGIDTAVFIDTGATDIRSSFPPDLVPGIVAAYAYGIRAVFATVAAFAGVAAVFAVGNKWERLTLD